MTNWNGLGLPPIAAARVARFASSPLRTSLLSVPATASLDAVGFRAVGEVLGCIVEQVSWSGYGGCGGITGTGTTVPGVGGLNFYQVTNTVLSSARSRFFGYGPYVNALENGYNIALRRMVQEAAALGADGVVGVQLSKKRLGEGDAHEFVAMGTAVRGRSAQRPSQPFTTDLSGPDVAKLLLAGWCPVELQVAIEIAIRHDDYKTQAQAGTSGFMNFYNSEVSGYTELVHETRGMVRAKLARSIAQAGADGGVISEMDLSVWGIEPAPGHHDHVAEATIRGTAIAAFDRRRVATSDAARYLTIMPMRSKSGR